MLNNKAIARNIIIDKYSFKKSNSIQFIYLSFGIIKEEDRSQNTTKNGGSAGTRTRGLLRDRQAL